MNDTVKSPIYKVSSQGRGRPALSAEEIEARELERILAKARAKARAKEILAQAKEEEEGKKESKQERAARLEREAKDRMLSMKRAALLAKEEFYASRTFLTEKELEEWKELNSIRAKEREVGTEEELEERRRKEEEELERMEQELFAQFGKPE